MTRPIVFLSASIPDGRKHYPARDRHVQTARPQWIRDAVLAITRAALQRDFGLRFGAHPSISPMVLTVAREYPAAAIPPIEVYQSKFFQGRYAPETYELVRAPHGVLCETDAMADKETSISHMRDQMLQASGLIAAVFIGGMDGVTDEANRFANRYSGFPAYAIASTGGATADLLSASQLSPMFAGAPIAPIDPALLVTERLGYTRVARAIFDALEHARTTGALHAP